MPEGGAFTNQIQTSWMCYKCSVLWCMSGLKAPIACVWHEERFYTAGPVPWNGGFKLMKSLGFPCPLIWYEFTILTHLNFLAFGFSTNVLLTLPTSWLLALYTQSKISIMANRMCMVSQQSSARPSWSIV